MFHVKKLKLIYNPFSGNKSFKFDLDVCARIFQEGGYEVHLFRSTKIGDIEKHLAEMDKTYDRIVVSGGDGTVNLVVNGMMNYGLEKIPLGIIPSGTANDFATYLNLKNDDIENCCKAIITEKPQRIDLGIANGIYFINVCGGGLLTNVSQHVDSDFKNTFGKLAYYVKGIEQLPNFCPIPLKITNSKEVIENDFYFFLVLNSAGAGSFDKLAPAASINDGYFDFIAVKAKPVFELAVLFVKILRGEHIGDSNILYFKDNYIKVESPMKNKFYKETSIDGETGPMMPIEIKMLHNAMKVIGKEGKKKV